YKELVKALEKGDAVILLKVDIESPEDAPGQAISTRASNITLDGQGHTIRGDNIPSWFLLGSKTLIWMRANKIDVAVVDKLIPLKGKKYKTREEFVAELEKVLAKEEMKRFGEAIVDRANFPKGGSVGKHILLFVGSKN